MALAAGGTPPSRSLRNKSSEGDIEGNGNVVVVTSRGYLRFFTGGGVQRYVWNLGADVVSMVAGREWVFVVHRDGGTSLDGMEVYCLQAFPLTCGFFARLSESFLYTHDIGHIYHCTTWQTSFTKG